MVDKIDLLLSYRAFFRFVTAPAPSLLNMENGLNPKATNHREIWSSGMKATRARSYLGVQANSTSTVTETPKYNDSIVLNRANNFAARAARILVYFLDVFPQNNNVINASLREKIFNSQF